MGIIEWLLVWLIVNALLVVWRVLVVSSETRDRSIRKMPSVADLWTGNGPSSLSKLGPQLVFRGLGAETGRLAKPAAGL